MDITLSNWRNAPFNRQSFQNIQGLLKTNVIAASTPAPLATGPSLDLDRITLAGKPVTTLLHDMFTDGLIVLHQGKIIAEHYPNLDARSQHILFSVSKSVTGTLSGILVGEGRLDPDAPVTTYLPEVKNSAYGTCTVRHVLDMTVDLDFVEDYLDTKGDFARYRVSTGWNPSNPAFGGEGLHEFLTTVKPAQSRHGEKFNYMSPNSDLLGWILERASGTPFAQLLSEKLWQPMGAEHDAFVTVDAKGAARTAGGITATLRDLARFAELMRKGGVANGKPIVPQNWITDILENGSREAWSKGSMTNLFPQGSYRSKWYKPNTPDATLCALGIHGQWIYINPRAEVTITKFASQPTPLDDAMDAQSLQIFGAIAKALA
jgi:CubicO group peptidase (beta-lactamase class C family)